MPVSQASPRPLPGSLLAKLSKADSPAGRQIASAIAALERDANGSRVAEANVARGFHRNLGVAPRQQTLTGEDYATIFTQAAVRAYDSRVNPPDGSCGQRFVQTSL